MLCITLSSSKDEQKLQNPEILNDIEFLPHPPSHMKDEKFAT